MQKNTILFVVLSAVTIFLWYYFFTPTKAQTIQQQTVQTQTVKQTESVKADNQYTQTQTQGVQSGKEETIKIETDLYKAVFSNSGASILSWSIKEKNGQWVDLVLPNSAPMLANFQNVKYKIVSKSNEKVIFEYASPEGWKIRKAYSLSLDSYLHNLNISILKTNPNAVLPKISLEWGPGLGTDKKEMDENTAVTRIIAYTAANPGKLKKLKNDSEQASLYRWAAIDNRYFLAAFIPEKSINFDEIISAKESKSQPFSLTMTALVPQGANSADYSINFYLGPKGYTYLKTYKIGLEKSVDFGFFGFLAKIALAVLSFFYKLTNNYGWAIILLTSVIQVLVLPLTLKSFKSAAAMKRVQPMIKEIQDKFKDNPQRLQAEMMNIYKTQKVNPLGGCLPMLLQLPIFWAFFQMLRNSYELRNEGWILWVKDLSAADHFFNWGFSIPLLGEYLNLLPLIMGVGMFLQQKMTSATSDPTQRRIMYIMPIVFTFMFWRFPAGLVLYWLTNSLCSMVVQFFVLRKDAKQNQVKVTRVS